MNTIDDEPAFPINGACADNQFNGMSLRDYFAIHATDEDIRSSISDLGRYLTADDTPLKIRFNAAKTECERIAIARLYFADVLLKARQS